MRGLSPVAESGGHSSSRCAGLSLSSPLLLRSTGSRRPGSAVVAHGLSCSVACGILPDQGSNPCPLHWQAESQPLRHQGSPRPRILNSFSTLSHNFPQTQSTPWWQGLHIAVTAVPFCRDTCWCLTSQHLQNLFSVFEKITALRQDLFPLQLSWDQPIRHNHLGLFFF